MRKFLNFFLATMLVVFGMAALTEAARASTPLERFTEKHGFDLCAPLDAVLRVIDLPYIKINLYDTDNLYAYAYVEDLTNGEQFFIEFYETSIGDVACMKQVWSGMFRDVVPAVVSDEPGWEV